MLAEKETQMDDIFLENLQIVISENKRKLTLKELVELYGSDFTPPYFIQNWGGRIIPCSEFWKHKFIELDKFLGAQLAEMRKNIPIRNDSSRTWRNKDRRKNKLIFNSVFKTAKGEE